ncbi:G-type lectin S-receptor-like serine/threonine-protein kinase CES101 [Mangifera indica]|uniref:G-type lectin S-receptor-like serine/threonine-protein kinase CES101 n=1 Tax=Mangifera indica TaxID=29780 RepID=UPI001CF9745B|nr:G-type lectin S-receptor-like serine/threonine-protein kinase CES101 [Mangifera indica]
METDTLKQGQRLHDWELLNSTGGVFRLGFLSLESDSALLGTFASRYIGIWFNRIPIYPVWVVNPNDPIPDSSGALIMDTDGILKIAYAPPIALSSNQAIRTSEKNITATLLDSGNLVIREVHSDRMAGPILWQRAFKLGLDPNGSSQLTVWRRGEVYWRSGAWKNGSFELATQITKRINEYEFRFVKNENESYFAYSVKNKSAVLSRWELESSGEITQFTLDSHSGDVHWIFETTSPCNTVAKNSTAVCLNEKSLKCRKASAGYVVGNNASLALSDCHAAC